MHHWKKVLLFCLLFLLLITLGNLMWHFISPFHCIYVTTSLLFESSALSGVCQSVALANIANASWWLTFGHYSMLYAFFIYYSLCSTNWQLLRLFETQIQCDTSQTNLVRKWNQPSEFLHRHKQNIIKNHFWQNVHKFQSNTNFSYSKEKRYFDSATFYKLCGCFVLTFLKFLNLCPFVLRNNYFHLIYNLLQALPETNSVVSCGGRNRVRTLKDEQYLCSGSKHLHTYKNTETYTR